MSIFKHYTSAELKERQQQKYLKIPPGFWDSCLPMDIGCVFWDRNILWYTNGKETYPISIGTKPLSIDTPEEG